MHSKQTAQELEHCGLYLKQIGHVAAELRPKNWFRHFYVLEVSTSTMNIFIYIFIRSERAASKKTNNKSNKKQTLTKLTGIYAC